MRKTKPIPHRFWPKVAVGPGCWEWQARRDAKGYGRFCTSTGVYDGAHRVSYRLMRGDIPPGMSLRHSCDNPSCVNPEHLLLGTHADNMADKVQRKRHRFGAKHGMSKLTEEQARAIKFDTRKGPVIAAEYGISTNAVNAIRCGRQWQHLEGVA